MVLNNESKSLSETLTGALLIPGAIILYAGIAPPSDFAFCDGTDLPRERYAARLFQVIGTTYGEGDGETTFNLPNLSSPLDGVHYIIRLGTDMQPLINRPR